MGVKGTMVGSIRHYTGSGAYLPLALMERAPAPTICWGAVRTDGLNHRWTYDYSRARWVPACGTVQTRREDAEHWSDRTCPACEQAEMMEGQS